MKVLHRWGGIWLAAALAVAAPACGGADDEDPILTPEGDGDADVDPGPGVAATVPNPRASACFGTDTTDSRFGDAMQALRDAMDRQYVPGGAIGVVWGGEIRHLGVAGSKGWECDPITTSTLFRAGVLTEPLTAATVLAATEEGDIALDESVTKWVPEFRAIGDEDAITVRQLLDHESGFSGDLALGECLPLHDWLSETYNDRIWSTPGSLYQHNPANYALAGLAVQEATRRPSFEFAAWLNVYGPLRMTQTTFHPDVAVRRDHTDGYGAWGGRVKMDHLDCGAERPAQGLITSIRDYTRFVAMLQNEGDGILTTESVEEITKGDAISFYPSHRMGFGLERIPARGAVPEMLVAQGSGEGFAQALIMVPAYRFAVVVFMNAQHGLPAGVARAAVRAFLSVPTAAAFEPGTYKGLTGTYRAIVPTPFPPDPFPAVGSVVRTMQVSVVGRYLIGAIGSGDKFILSPTVDRDVFAPRTDQVFDQIRFWRDRTGKATVVTPRTTAEGPPLFRVR